jgi:hypothetical protein
MTIGIGSARTLLQHSVVPGTNLPENASVTITALRGTSQPRQSSAKTDLKRNTTVYTGSAPTSVNATQPGAPWQASVTSERPQLPRCGGDLIDDAKHQQDEDERRQCSARGFALRHVVELRVTVGQHRRLFPWRTFNSYNLNIWLRILRCKELINVAALDDHESCKIFVSA